MKDSKTGQTVVSLTKYQIFESMALVLTSFTQGWLTLVAQFKYSSIHLDDL